MLTAYLTSLIIGGSLLMLSIFAGGDHEMDHDLELGTGDLEMDLDFDVEVDGDADFGGFDVHGFDAWLPIGSLRFWTFFAAFFGLVGTALSLVGGLSMALILAPAIGTGYLSGVTATKVLKALTTQSVGKVLSGADLVGVSGVLVLPVGPKTPGKIRFQLAGRVMEETAYSEESLAIGARALIIDIHKEGGVWITLGPLLAT